MEHSRDRREEAGSTAIDGSRPGVFLMTNTLETGGTERQFVNIAQALDREMFAVSLGCLKRKGALLEEISGLTEFSPGGSLLKWQSQRARLALVRQLRRERIAVSQSFDFYSNLMLIPAAHVARVPVVLGSHRQLGDLLTPMKFRAQKAVFRLCDRVVCNSRAAAERLLEAGIPQRKLEVIPNGLPDALFELARPVLPRNGDTVNVGMISRMNDPAKGHNLFLRAAAQLLPRFPQLRFVLAGDGPLRSGLEQLVGSLGITNRVVFLGDQRDMPAVLASLDISVLPSSSESLSNAILESMAACVPVIASCVGGNLELIEHGQTGLLVPPGDQEQLASAIELMLTQQELRKRCSARARERVSSEYRVANIRDRYQGLYRSLLVEKGWRPEVLTT